MRAIKLFQRIREQLDKINAPELDWIQVEVTTRCNSSCIYCPQTAMGRGFSRKHMPMDLFLRLIPYTLYTKMIYLQGWGEPLLHPSLFEMIRLCKERGKTVGFTTNGMLLDKTMIQRILDSQPDIMGVSLAGTRANTHNRFREGNDFDQVISNLQLLDQMKRKNNSPYPSLHLAYLMLKSNFHELESVVPLAEKLGAKQIVSSHLSLIMDGSLFSEALFNDKNHADMYLEKLSEIQSAAAARGILFSYNQPRLDENSMRCNENVRGSCVINVDGEVAPCVFTDPVLNPDSPNPADSAPTYLFKDRVFPIKGVSFGNIRNENLTRIHRKRAYADFRDCFDSADVPSAHRDLVHLPEPCKHCYKRLIK